MVEATPETFKDLTREGSVLVDFWGPRCQPCLQMMPTVERLEQESAGAVKVVKVCLLYTSPSPRDRTRSRMPSSA